MGKGRRRDRSGKIRPDQVEFIGPLRFSRFGKYIHVKNDLQGHQQTEMTAHWVGKYPEICAEINQCVAKIRALVVRFDPLLLLQCGLFTFLHSAMGKASESEYKPEDIVSHRMIDYIQSVIVSTPVPEDLTGRFDQSLWEELHEAVGKLYGLLNLPYHTCHTAHLKLTSKSYDEAYDSLYVAAQLQWTNVRGNRYQAHDIPYLESLLLPHNDIFQDLFGISIPEFLSGLKKLQYNLTMGLPDTVSRMKEINELVRGELGDEILSEASSEMIQDATAKIIQQKGLEEELRDLHGRFIGFDLCDVQKNTNYPIQLLDHLSFKPGEYTPFFEPGEYCGWPLRLLPIQIRPFIKVGDGYYCFDLHNLFDYLYRVVQRMILRLRPDYERTWNEKQKGASEEIPFDLFKRILPSSQIFRPVFHKWRTGKDLKQNWCETDGLIIYDDHLLIVEIKGGAFTYTPPASDFPAYLGSIKDLLQKPAEQAKRFLDYLESDNEVEVYGSDRRPLLSLQRRQFRHITSCCITLNSLTTLSAQYQSLPLLDEREKSFPTWHLSIDDLRVCADLFTSPLVFLHFLQKRQKAALYPRLSVHDELEHMSLYFSQNDYVELADSLKEANVVSPFGFMEQIDRFYHSLMNAPAFAKRPGQKLPSRLAEVLKILERKGSPGRCKVAACLLDMSGESRRAFCDAIDETLKRQKTRERIVPFSFSGDIKITAFCSVQGMPEPTSQWKKEYVLAYLLRSGDKERLSLSLFFDAKNSLTDIGYDFVSLNDVPEGSMADIKAESERQARSLIKAFMERTGTKKIGRNERCPCGSGKKYKMCCGR